jgi:hypothetical protein
VPLLEVTHGSSFVLVFVTFSSTVSSALFGTHALFAWLPSFGGSFLPLGFQPLFDTTSYRMKFSAANGIDIILEVLYCSFCVISLKTVYQCLLFLSTFLLDAGHPLHPYFCSVEMLSADSPSPLSGSTGSLAMIFGRRFYRTYLN